MAFETPNRWQQENRNIQMVYAMRPPYVGLAIASLVAGILAFLTGITVVLGLAFGAAAIWMGWAALRTIARAYEPRSGKALAIVGIITGSMGVLGALMMLLVAQALSTSLNG